MNRPLGPGLPTPVHSLPESLLDVPDEQLADWRRSLTASENLSDAKQDLLLRVVKEMRRRGFGPGDDLHDSEPTEWRNL